MSQFWVDQIKGDSVLRAWDQLVLGGETFPGLCQIEPSVELSVDVVKWVTNPNSIDENNPPKYEARLVDKGYGPGRLRATVAVWTPDQWRDLQDVLPRYTPKEAQDIRDAFDILHPATKLIGITSVLVTKVTLRPPVMQTLYVELEMLQWFPRSPFKKVRPNGGALNDADASVAAPKPAGNL